MDKNISTYIETINELDRIWTPHPAQITIGKALFNDEIKQIFAKCGRNFGKTELVAYILWRWARCNPNSENYFFAPFAKQAKELVWASRRIQNFGPRQWLLPSSGGINNSELRLRFTNGSFIKLDGADNIDSYRGVKPKGVTIYDEYKDFRPDFHDTMDPNYAAHDSPLIVIGTPPEIEDHHFYHLEDEFKINPKKAAFEFSSYENPHIDPKMFEAKKEELYRRGEGDVFEREYMVRKVFGGKNSIFPMYDPNRHVKPHDQIMDHLKNDMKKLRWILWADPGTATCFAVLFGCMNPYTKKIYLLDEIYETDQKKTSVSIIGRAIIDKKNELYARGDWDQGYDEAASWFNNEMIDQFNESFTPSHKILNKKEQGLSLMKDMFLADLIVVSDRCVNYSSEILNYVRDKNGKIPKEKDHLIDDNRYILGHLGYDMNTALEQADIETRNAEMKPFYSMEEDFKTEMEAWGFEEDYG